MRLVKLVWRPWYIKPRKENAQSVRFLAAKVGNASHQQYTLTQFSAAIVNYLNLSHLMRILQCNGSNCSDSGSERSGALIYCKLALWQLGKAGALWSRKGCIRSRDRSSHRNRLRLSNSTRSSRVMVSRTHTTVTWILNSNAIVTGKGIQIQKLSAAITEQ